MPELSAPVQAVIRCAYGVLLLGTLLMALPHGRRFFLSERWGGYGKSTPEVDGIQNPVVYPTLMCIWLACACLIALGRWTVPAAFVNLLLCRYFFVQMRWKGVARGMGAPGFMTYWLGAVVLLLEYTSRHAPAQRPLALLVAQADFAFIMLSAGLYKLSAGYARNYGMELGLANPAWGYWWRTYAGLPPGHSVFRVMNQLAWSTEVVAAILMLVPPTRFLGGLLIVGSFLFIATQIRLGLLCETVVVTGLLFVNPGAPGDAWIAWLLPASASAPAGLAAWPVANAVLAACLWAYLGLLPFVHAGLFYNFYGRRSLPRILQGALETYSNFFGIIIWRVFSVDVVNFFVRIYEQPRHGGDRILVSHYGLRGGLRYSHVCESIAVTSVFTTLKYYPSNDALFRERLLRYARTVPCRDGCVLTFEYVSIRKELRRFEFIPVAEFVVDARRGSIEERILDRSVLVRAAHAVSPVHEGTRPGTYAPLES
jgi:hypothetical protein